MDSHQPHRKRVRHYHEPGSLHELTFSCYHRMPLLTNNVWRGLLSQSIDRAIHRHGFRLAAFVYMPEHVHLLVYPAEVGAHVEDLLRAIKRPFSYRIKCLLREVRSPLLRKLTIRQRPGAETFRFWQEGPGYDRNLTEDKTIRQSVDYIHTNPVLRGLVESAVDWRWSSIRYYTEEAPKIDPLLPIVHGLPPEMLGNAP